MVIGFMSVVGLVVFMAAVVIEGGRKTISKPGASRAIRSVGLWFSDGCGVGGFAGIRGSCDKFSHSSDKLADVPRQTGTGSPGPDSVHGRFFGQNRRKP
jgi:hypothetical protein